MADAGRKALSDSQLIVGSAILAVELALTRNPAPDDRLDLIARLADLETVKDRLQARRNQMRNGRIVPAPPSGLVAEIQILTTQVETAKNRGTAANAVVDVARQAFDVATRVLSHGAGPGR